MHTCRSTATPILNENKSLISLYDNISFKESSMDRKHLSKVPRHRQMCQLACGHRIEYNRVPSNCKGIAF